MATPTLNNIPILVNSFPDINSVMGVMQTKDKKTGDILGRLLRGMDHYDRGTNGLAGLTNDHINNAIIGPNGNAGSLHELGHITSEPNN
jgi:hypothetical protein